MKRVVCAMFSLGVITLLIAAAPDIRRYLRMRCMQPSLDPVNDFT